MRHLITGGSGFIGNLVARALSERGEAVRILDLWIDPSLPKGIEAIKGSVLDRDCVAAAMRGVDMVHHNAALVVQTGAVRRFGEVNVRGTRIVAQEAVLAGVKTIVHLSSTAVYGIPPDGPITAATPLNPVEPYGRSKLAGEAVMRDICERYGIALTTIRPRATLGAGRLGIFQILFEWIRQNRDVYVVGSGENRVQFVHAHDLMDFYMRAVETGRPGTYNVGTDRFGIVRQDLGDLIVHAGGRSRVRGVPEALGVHALRLLYRLRLSPLVPWHYRTCARDCYFDIEPLRGLGWRPRYSNTDMLRESYDWFLGQRHSAPSAQASPHRSPLRQGALGLARHIP